MKRRDFLKNTLVGGGAGAFAGQSENIFALIGAADRTLVVGDENIRVTLKWSDTEITEESFSSGGTALTGIAGIPWTAEITGGRITPKSGRVQLAREEKKAPARQAIFEGETDLLQWTLRYEMTGTGRITKTLRFTPRKDLALKRLSLWSARSTKKPLVTRTKLQDIAAFYRHGEVGLLVSLDFPYSQIETIGEETSVSYPPHEVMKGGHVYECHSITIGAIHLTGRERYGHDEGEVAAMDSYIQERYQPRFERPMFVSASIVNRYTQVQDGIVWYTYKDHPTFSFHHDLLKREISLMPRVGMEYYQLFPGVFEWEPDDPAPETVEEIVDHARQHDVRVGDYSVAANLVGAHYNEYGKKYDRPEWALQEKESKKRLGETFCLGHPEYVKYYGETVAQNAKRFGFELHCFDFLNIQPCYATDHGHPPGPESIYQQVKGLVRLLETVNSVSPHMMSWSNAGNWQEFLPKLAWTNQNLYLTDPFIDKPWQGLNMTRLLDDVRREQMVSLHYSHFIPYRFLTNCQYFFSQNSVVPDIRNFAYGALSTLAVTPNLTLCEVRPWLDRLPPPEQEQVIGFYKHWTDFLKKNFGLWKKTYHVGENPGMGGVEIYSHARDDHGYIFLINPHYWDRTVEVPLDAALGFAGTGRCELVELYPVERLRLTAQGPFVQLGSRLPVDVPARQVIVLEVRPAPEKVASPRIYGLPGTIEPAQEGYLIKTHWPQGRTERLAVLLPPGSHRIADAAVRSDIPKIAKRLWSATPLNLLADDEEGVLMEVTFRRTLAPTELREWQVRPGDLDSGIASKRQEGFKDGRSLRFPLFVDVVDSSITLPLTDNRCDELGLGPLANFCGAFIDNAFSEMQETWIELKEGTVVLSPGPLRSKETTPERKPLDPLAKDQTGQWWLQTSFHLPFMYTIGAEPSFDEHTILVLPLVRHTRVKQIKAWINGRELKIDRYFYPRNRRFSTYYADLVGSGARGGDNILVLQMQY
jgi:hypothetical protein